MGVVIDDPFTEASDTVLTSHVPNTVGTGWTLEEQINTTRILEVESTSDTVKRQGTGTRESEGLVYSAQPDVTEADVDVEVDIAKLPDSSTNPMFVIARWADTSNHYSAGTYRLEASADKKIFKETTTTITELASGDSGLIIGDTIKFELRGTTLKLFHNGVEKLSATDSDHSAAGKCGLGMGALWVSTDDFSHNNEFDNFKVTEFAAAVGLVMAPYVPA